MEASTLERVRALIAKSLRIPAESIGEDASLEELGLDSLGALELVFEIEEEFKVKVPDEAVRGFKSVRAICEGLDSLRSS
jgi:acyl carrier protein